jgi:hypothetical protein
MAVAGSVRWPAEFKAHPAAQAATGDRRIIVHGQHCGISRVCRGQEPREAHDLLSLLLEASVSSVVSCGLQVAEYEAVTFDDLTGLARYRLGKDRSAIDECMELTVLAAGIDVRGQFG